MSTNDPTAATDPQAETTTRGSEAWPELPLEAWSDTYATLHRWLQIVGKIRLKQTPWMNHGWHVALYVTGRGLTTSPIPYENGSFQIDFDFCAHRLVIRTSDAREGQVPLRPQTTAAFYRQLWDELERLGLHIKINRKPNEVEDTIPFDEDEVHASYDPEYAHRFWRVLVQVERVFQVFRARFIGKCSPIHLFWGAVDLATTRFSGRPAPEHPGGIPNLPDAVTKEAYSHEVSSAGFWPGGGAVAYPAFYSYAYPEPAGFADAPVRPAEAFYHPELREFLLPYDAVRQSASPDQTLLEFLQTTYEAAANPAGWDRATLERSPDWQSPAANP
jgi:hypothetical protein